MAAYFPILFAVSKAPFTTHAYYDRIHFWLFTSATALLFLLLCMIQHDKYITLMLILTAELYFASAAANYGDYVFSFGLCLILCGIVFYSDLKNIAVRFSGAALWGLASALIIAFTLFTGIIGCLYYKNYWTPCFDFGLFSQMFYFMKETGKCLVTCERDGLLNHFAVHFSPIFYLLLPLYMLIPSPCTLLVAQGFIVASGVLPLVLICKKFKLSNTAAGLFAVCYVLYPAFAGGCFFYLHENCFLAPLILWFIYFSEKNQTLPASAAALLILLVKEDAAVYTAVISLYFLFSRKKLQTKPCPIRYLHTVLYYGHTFDVCLWKRRYVRPLQQLYLRRRRAVYRDKSRTSKSHIYGAANIHAGKANFYAANVRAAGLSPADVQIARKTDPADSAHADQPDDELSIPI